MKRLTSLLLLLLGSVAFTQCNAPAEQPIEGIWLSDYARTVKQITSKYNRATGQSGPLATPYYDTTYTTQVYMLFDFLPDKRCVVKFFGSAHQEGTYSRQGNQIEVTVDTTLYNLTLKNNTLVRVYNEGRQTIFNRVPSPMPGPDAPIQSSKHPYWRIQTDAASTSHNFQFYLQGDGKAVLSRNISSALKAANMGQYDFDYYKHVEILWVGSLYSVESHLYAFTNGFEGYRYEAAQGEGELPIKHTYQIEKLPLPTKAEIDSIIGQLTGKWQLDATAPADGFTAEYKDSFFNLELAEHAGYTITYGGIASYDSTQEVQTKTVSGKWWPGSTPDYFTLEQTSSEPFRTTLANIISLTDSTMALYLDVEFPSDPTGTFGTVVHLKKL